MTAGLLIVVFYSLIAIIGAISGLVFVLAVKGVV